MMNSNQQEVINGFPNGGATAKLLLSFADAEASKHYFCTSNLGGGEISHLFTLPGCDNKPDNPCTCYVSDVVNGVVCFSNGKDVYVLNPATGDILTLPRSDEYDKLNHANLKTVLYSAYAFGFDLSKKEYKVLHLFGLPQLLGCDLLDDQKFEVFKVRTKRPETTRKGEEEEEEDNQVDAWRKATSLPPCPSYIIRGQGVYVNGSIYWLRVSSPGKDAIVCFNVASEMFRSIPIPFILPYQRSLSCVRGRLVIQGIEKATGSSPTLGVWILEDIKEESKWNKNTVEIADPKEQKGVKFHVLVGDDSTGDMVVMRSAMPERYQVVCLSGNKKTAAERTITLVGLPSWVDLNRGSNKLNFRIHNYVESRVALDPIVIKEVKNPIVEVKKVGKYQPPKTQQAFPPPPPLVGSQRAKKTYYGGHGQARNVQNQQFSRSSQSSAHDGHGLARGVQSQQFSRATQSSGHGQARGAQPSPKNHNGQSLIRFGEFDPQVVSNSAPRQTLIRIGEIDVQLTI